MPVKQNLKEHFEDGRLDLSMLALTEVPVKDIAAIPKATSLDLSNNRLTSIGKNFPLSLTHLVHLDLARNQLVELPENIGLLVNLKHLDLYSNQLTSLPLSFGNLKTLRWLDLKQNPLMPKLAQIAGPCLDSTQCASAAKNVVELLLMMNKQVEVEKQRRQEQRQKQLEENERKAQELKKKEQQSQKKKNKKGKKNVNGSTKLLDSLGNGDVDSGSSENLIEGKGFESGDELQCNNFDPDSDGFHHNEPLLSSSSSSTTFSNLKTSLKQNKSRKVIHFFSILVKVVIVSVMIVTLGLFILNLLNEDYYNAVRKQLIRGKNQISGYLPKPVVFKFNRMYVTSRKLFWKTANHVGKMSINLIESAQEWYLWISTEETVQAYYEQIKSGWLVLWIRISEIYRTFLGQAAH
ncbi:uncharacterized protein LOC142328723 [Lycorma delicatula]|uniref:uncharacterized protein LOC142328723 n=1 Tax=Lycorma delicatula TaxID=130591 RepID=UPI003F513BBB